MKTESLDTNVLLRLTLKDIPSQFEQAKALIMRDGYRYLVADTAIIEYVFVLERHYRLTRPQIAEMVFGLMTIDKLILNRPLIETALIGYQKYTALSFEDCYLAAVAQSQAALPLWTFDKALAKKHPAARGL